MTPSRVGGVHSMMPSRVGGEHLMTPSRVGGVHLMTPSRVGAVHLMTPSKVGAVHLMTPSKELRQLTPPPRQFVCFQPRYSPHRGTTWIDPLPTRGLSLRKKKVT